MNEAKESKPRAEYSDEEVNELSDWLNDLTIAQLFFLKQSYDAFLAMEAIQMGSLHVH